jgi:hypothetical protein
VSATSTASSNIIFAAAINSINQTNKAGVRAIKLSIFLDVYGLVALNSMDISSLSPNFGLSCQSKQASLLHFNHCYSYTKFLKQAVEQIPSRNYLFVS